MVLLVTTCVLHRLSEDEHPPAGEPQVCKKCHSELPARWFHLAPKNSSGREGGCLACRAARRRTYSSRECVVPQEKECSKCHRTLAAACFSRRRASPDGLRIICKEYHSEYTQSRKRALVQVEVPSKRCCVCKTDKPAAAFSVARRVTDGLATECKECKIKLELRRRQQRLQQQRQQRQQQ